MTPEPLHPDRVREISDRMFRSYGIHIRHDLRPYRLRSWSASVTHGCFHVGYPTDLVRRARTRERLLEKCERWIRRDALRNGIRDPDIWIDERTP